MQRWRGTRRSASGSQLRQAPAAVQLALAFRSALFGIVSSGPTDGGLGELAGLLVVAASRTFFFVVLAEVGLGLHRLKA